LPNVPSPNLLLRGLFFPKDILTMTDIANILVTLPEPLTGSKYVDWSRLTQVEVIPAHQDHTDSKMTTRSKSSGIHNLGAFASSMLVLEQPASSWCTKCRKISKTIALFVVSS